MLEYVNKDGYTYTEDEINQFAKDNNTSFDDILQKNGLTPKKQKQTSLPGKEKTVTKKDANVAATNMASKSAKPSSVSRTKLWDANAEFDTTLVSKALGIQKLTSTNPISKEAKQKKKKFVEEAVFEQPSEIFRSPFVTEEMQESVDIENEKRRLQEAKARRPLTEEEKQQKYLDLKEATELEDKYILENPEYAEADAIINRAGVLDENFLNELNEDIAKQKSRNGKIETNYQPIGIGSTMGTTSPISSTVKEKFVAFPKQREQLIAQFKKAKKSYTENDLLEASANLYAEQKKAAQIYNQKYDAFEDLDDYDPKVQDFIKTHNLNKKKIADYDLAKLGTQKTYVQNILEKQQNSRKDLISQLKPQDYTYTTQEELDKQNNLIAKINSLGTKMNDNAKYLTELHKKSGELEGTSTSLAKDIELAGKEWGWWARTGRKIMNSVVDMGLSVAGGIAYIDDMLMEAATSGKWKEGFGKEISAAKELYRREFEEDLPEARETTYSLESFGENAANAIISQLPQILTIALAPEAYAPELVGFISGAATGTGSKYLEMIGEQERGVMNELGEIEKQNYSTAQLFAVPALFGLFEGGTEYVGGRAIGRMQKMFGKATKAEMETLTGAVNKTIGEKAKEISKGLLQNYGEEVPSEVFNTVLGNFTDKTLLDKKDKDLLEGVPETIFDTAVVSTLFATAPHVAGAVYRQFIPATYAKQLVENNNKIAEILKGVDYEKLSPEEKTIIDNKIKGIKDSSTIIINNIAETIGATDAVTLLGVDKLSKDIIEIRKEANIINNSQNLTQEQKDGLLSDMAKEHLNTTTEYNRVLGNVYRAEQMNKKAASWLNKAKLNRENLRGEKYLTTVMATGKDVKYKNASNKELIDMALLDPEYSEIINDTYKAFEAESNETYSAEQKTLIMRSLAGQIVKDNGMYDSKTNTIYINRDTALRNKAFTTARHEVFHKVIENFSNNMGNIGKSLYSFVEEQHIGDKAFKDTKFAKRMQREFDDLAKEIDILDSQKEAGKINAKEYNDLVKQKENIANEEVSTILVESLIEGDIKIDKSNAENLKFDADGNVIINNAKDMFNFIAAYNESYTKTRKSDIIEAASKGKVAGELITEKPVRSTEPTQKKSKSNVDLLKAQLEELKDNESDYDPYDFDQQVANLQSKIKKAIEKEKTEVKPVVKKELSDEDEVNEIVKSEKGSIASDKVQKLYEDKGMNAAQDIINLFKPITKRIVDKRRDAPGFDRELLTDEIETGSGGILDLIKSYSSEKGVPLAAYINKQLPLRAIAASRRVLEGDFKKDVTEEKGLMAEETVSETKEKPKYKNALESKVFEPEVLKTMSDKIITQLRTLKSRIDEPISLNRTVTPLIAEIRDAIGKQLDIDVKKAMGGKKDNELVNWLLKNKRYMLENMTTTWLMGANGQGGIPQAVQKRIDGKWVSYPDWVDQKIDRESVSTDNAGRTSGAELVRRLPNVFNNVSDEDYLGQFVGPDGNPIRGRKESGAKAVAEETAFDIINKDLAEEGEIYNALSTNQQRQGYEVLNNFAAEFSRQSERGNVKYSKVVREAIDDIQSLPINVKNELIGPDGNRFIEFAKSVRGSGEVEKQFNIKYKNTDIPQEYKNKILKSIKTLYRYFEKNKLNTKLMVFKIKEGEKFEKYANRIVFNALSKEQSVALTLGINVNDLRWRDDLDRLNAQSHINDFIENAKEFLTSGENKISEDQALVKLTQLFSRSFAYGDKQSLYGKQSDFFNQFLNNNKKFALKDLGGNKFTIIYNGNKVNREILPQDTSATDISKYIKDGNSNAIKLEDRSKATEIARKDLRQMMDLLHDMYKNNNLTDTQLGLIFKSLGGSMNSVLKLSSELRYAANREGYSNNPKEWVYEHTPPSSYLSRIAIGIITGKNNMSIDDFMEKLVANSYVAIIPKSVDNDINSLYKSTMPFNYSPGDNPLIRYYDAGFNGFAIPALSDLKTGELINREIVRNEFNSPNVFETQEAVLSSLDIGKKSKGISVFDFDDTVGLTKSNVLYTMPDGSKGKLNGAEFAKNGARLLEEGAVFDFSEFSKVVEGRPGPMVEKMKKMIGKFGPENFFILTARPADSAVPIHEFLSTIGIDIPLENITGLGNSSAQAKADWIVEKANEGYDDFYFADDHLPNVTAVKNALDVLDVKSKIQQARAKFSKSMNYEFNRIIEENTGTERYKVFSDIVARRRGAKKNRFDIYVPPSAADFELLLYNFLGKGKRGDYHKEFFTNAFLKPYTNGNDLMDAARQSIKKNYKALLDSFPDISKKLESLTPDGDFTYDQAIRVAIWNESDVEIPGISKRDIAKLTNLVNNDPQLEAFKQGLIVTGRQGKGWVTPEEHWDANTIISDLHNLTEGAGRKKFLGEFIGNVEEVFGKWDNGKLTGPNMNKVEAVYGTNVREALEDILYRMTTGKNKGFNNDKESSRWARWVNGSTGTIMFLNTRSAVLQLLGAVNFLNFRDNNPYAAAKAFANQPQYWKDFARIWNSDKMKERRGGLKEDVAAAEIANAAAGSKNKVNAVVSYLLKIGYTPTQLADSFAIASGGAPFYRNRINSYLKEGKTLEEAEKLAWQDFTKVSDETQQSGDPKDISKQQASPAGRLLLTFQNTAMQQSRIVKKAILDLKNRRGDDKTNISKIVYYLTIQNLMFSALQQGLFTVAFGGDDEDDEKIRAAAEKTRNEKLVSVAGGVLDSILRGTGFIGGITATIKNMILKYIEESEKKQADYAKVVFEGANISPPIGSKLKKLYSGLNQTKYDKDLIKERGWGIMQDGRVHLGPMYSIGGKVVESTTNLPMDRLQNKIENVSQAMNSQNQAWQRVMIGMGWSPYSVGVEGTPGDAKIEAAGKTQRKEEGKIKAEETRQRKKDSIKNLPFEERIKLKMESRRKRRENKRKRRMG
jgi:hypothetical protein